jgi:hypothetical protein
MNTSLISRLGRADRTGRAGRAGRPDGTGRPRQAIVADGLDRLRGVIPVPATDEYLAVLAAGSEIHCALSAQIGGVQILKAAADFLEAHDPVLSERVPFFSREEIFEACLGGLYIATALRRASPDMIRGIEIGLRALAFAHLEAARNVCDAANALLERTPRCYLRAL